MECKIATQADKESVFQMIDENCASLPEGTCTSQNYKAVAEHVLSDIDWGFFILAINKETSKPVGIMYFTYEWSDWRNGVFFWLQTAYAQNDSEDVHKAMLAFLEDYQKTRGCCGYRLCSEKVNKAYWEPIVKRMELCTSHYFIYEVKTE